MTVVSDLEQDWHTWHAARERDLDTDYGWLSIVAFDWLPPTPTALDGLAGKWWADEQAHVTAAGELTLGGEPVHGTVSASVPEAGSLSWLLHGNRLAELVLRGGRYAIRQRDPEAATRKGFAGVPAYPLDEAWAVTGRPRRLPGTGAGHVPYTVNANGRLIVRLKSIRTDPSRSTGPVVTVRQGAVSSPFVLSWNETFSRLSLAAVATSSYAVPPSATCTVPTAVIC
jgi:hypothetical protein